MQTKLTLRMEEATVERAKAWAKQRGVSLSASVEQFFESLSAEEPSLPLNPWTLRLVGAGGRTGHAEESAEDRLREDYLDHLEAKYR